MSTEHGDDVQPIVTEKATHGAPQPPADDLRTKEEVLAAQAAAKAAAEGTGDPEEIKDGKPPVKTEDKQEDKKSDAELQAAIEAARLEERKDWQDDYVKLDNEAGNAVIDLLKEKEVSPIEANAIFEKAIASGNLDDVDWATLEKKLGPAQAKLAKAGIHQYYEDVYSVQRSAAAKVFEIMGSKENWETVKTWAQKKEANDLSYKTRVDEYRRLLDQGGFGAEAAARALMEDYAKDSNTKGLTNASLFKGSSTPEVQGGALTKAEYLKLRNEAHNNGATEKEIEILVARRKAGMQAGV